MLFKFGFFYVKVYSMPFFLLRFENYRVQVDTIFFGRHSKLISVSLHDIFNCSWARITEERASLA